MAEIPEPTVRVTRYEVGCIPESVNPLDADVFSIKVEYRGFDRWAVTRIGRCLGTDGKWVHESIPSGREDDWLDAHWFDEETALRLAREAAPHVRVNGHTVADVLRRGAERG